MSVISFAVELIDIIFFFISAALILNNRRIVEVLSWNLLFAVLSHCQQVLIDLFKRSLIRIVEFVRWNPIIPVVSNVSIMLCIVNHFLFCFLI